MCIFTFRPSSSPFSMLFINSVSELQSLLSHILLKNCFASLEYGCGYVCEPFLPTCWKNFFRCCEITCFVCIVWSYLCIFLVFLLSPLPSDLSLWVLSIVLMVLRCSFRPNIFSRFSSVLIFLFVVKAFLFVFPVWFPIQVLSFCSCFYEHPDSFTN